MSASDFLSGTKSNKCCCCQCPDGCENIGSLVPDCSACGEIPLDYAVGGFCGAILGGADYFDCCPGFFALAHLLIGSSTSCAYESLPFSCPELSSAAGVVFVWRLNLAESGDCTDPRLRLEGDDGTVIVWRMPPSTAETFRPLCTNWLLIRRSETIAGSIITDPVALCFLPRFLCLSAVPSCCPTRTRPLPRRLTLTLTGATCDCADGTVIYLDWNNTTDKWEGTGDYCGSTMTVKIWCLRTLPSGSSWQGTVDWVGGCMGAGVHIDLAARYTIAECDPVHLRWTFSTPGCCATIFANTIFDVTE